MAEVSIERLTEATAEAAVQIAELLQQLTSSAQPLDEARLEVVLKAPGALYVARDKDKIIGTVCRLDLYHPVRTESRIEDVVVDEAYRGQGIARRLMELAISDAPATAESVNLNSNVARVASHRMYAKLGFELREETRIWRLKLPPAGDR